MTRFSLLAAAALATAVSGMAGVRMSEQTAAAFDAYVKQVEPQMDTSATALLERARARALQGEIIATPFAYRRAGGSASVPVKDGLVNHWLGMMFVRGASVDQVRAVLQDYTNYSRIYEPDVAESRLLKSSKDEFDVFLRLHRQVRVKALLGYSFPVEFNSNYRVRYYQAGDTLQVRSVATRIAEVRDPKKSHTDEMAPGDDSGYLWRLRAYWRVTPAPDGVFVECEAVSLSRSVPSFVEKMVTYFTTNFPEDSMKNTLGATRDAVIGKR